MIKFEKFSLKSIKTQMILFLTSFALYLGIIDKDMAFLGVILMSIVFSVLVQMMFAYSSKQSSVTANSSVIMGLIIGFVLASDQPWWIYLLAASIAVGSKYLIRYKNKHLLNPAAFGIFLVIILFSAQTQWKGTYLWYILAPAGLYFIYRIKKVELFFSYFSTAFILFGIKAFLQKIPILTVFGFFSYFYVFIMLIEPKTTPVKPLGKIIFGIGIAVLIFILTETGVNFDVELTSLLILNLAVPLLNKIEFKKGADDEKFSFSLHPHICRRGCYRSFADFCFLNARI